MELSWLSRLRLTLAIATGVVLLAIVAGPLVRPADSFMPVKILHDGIPIWSLLALAALAFTAGFIAYFLAWPYGREMAVVAAPAGLAAISMRGGSMANLFQMQPTVADRAAAYAAFRWEGFLWLAVVVAGLAGMICGWHIRRPAPESRPNAVNPEDTGIKRNGGAMLNVILALVMATAIGYIGLLLFVRGIPTPSGSATISSQPLTAQIAAGSIIAFGLAGFAVKKLLNLAWPIAMAATGLVNFAAMTLAANPTLLSEMADKYPPAMFAQTTFAILPIQLIAFGSMGAVLGYWLAVRFNIWRKEVKVM